MINSLHIENFTVFKKADFEFVPGVNVLVGGNATGKTHVLKLLYAMQKTQLEIVESDEDDDANELGDPRGRLHGVFRPEKIGDLVRRNSINGQALINALWNGTKATVTIGPGVVTLPVGMGSDGAYIWNEVTGPVFIPAKDVLALSPGFLSLYKRREVEYDETYPDIIEAAQLDVLRESERNGYQPLLDELTGILQATVERDGDRFYLRDDNGRIAMQLVAEGWRKIALLYQLIANGSIGKDTVLYWDEPECNLNPSLMDEVVDVLLKLSRMGTQIFLATHEYIILKELELQKKNEDSLRMFALERSTKDGSVKVQPADEYSELKPNLIAKQYDRLYDLTVARALGVSDAD